MCLLLFKLPYIPSPIGINMQARLRRKGQIDFFPFESYKFTNDNQTLIRVYVGTSYEVTEIQLTR